MDPGFGGRLRILLAGRSAGDGNPFLAGLWAKWHFGAGFANGWIGDSGIPGWLVDWLDGWAGLRRSGLARVELGWGGPRVRRGAEL